MKQLRINDPTQLDIESIEQQHADGHDIIVQFSRPIYSPAILRMLNRLSDHFSSRFQVRFYGHYGASFDCLTVRSLPSVRSLAVDCLRNAENVDALHGLENLEEMSLGVFELDKRDILKSRNFLKLKSLTLGETRNKGIDLSPIGEFESLASLLISSHTKGIEAISHLTKLSSLRLRQIPKSRNLGFVSAIDSLTELDIVLGGRNNIHEITSPNIRKLRIIRVLGLDSFQANSFPGLEELQIEDQIRMNEISFSYSNTSLSRILLINCKNLSMVRGLGLLPELREIRISKTAVDVNDLLTAALPKTLRTFAFYTGKEGENLAIRAKLDELGYNEMGGAA